MAEAVANGKVISLEYTLKLHDDQVVDSNVGQDPLTYTQGAKQIIPAVEVAVEGMTVGQAKTVVVEPPDGYGDIDPDAIQEVPKDKIPEDIKVGTQLQGKDAAGQEVRPIVKEVKDDTVILDFNHPLAGKTLFFNLKVLDVQ